MPDTLSIPFDNSFAREMGGFYVPWEGAAVPAPAVLRLNTALAEDLGLDPAVLTSPEAAAALSGAHAPQGAAPLAMAYAGHQFGGFSAQLGDGRALLLGEIVDRNGARRDLHLKGSGKTPFSRGGDGKAVLKPVLREYLMGEAMHALGIPTTRALAAVTTGEKIVRDGQAALVAKWVNVGFVHGVMNTDNTTISGETIDYGPCAFIDAYDPKALYSSIDEQGRYAYGNQPVIMQWNLSRFAETLIPLINPEDSEDAIRQLTNEVNAYPAHYQQEWLRGMQAKLGLSKALPDDLDLANGLLAAAEGQSVDFTQLFRALAGLVRGEDGVARALFDDAAAFEDWAVLYRNRLKQEGATSAEIAAHMDAVNPLYIPRNHLVEAALEAAAKGDMAPFDALSDVLAQPLKEQPGAAAYAQPAPADFGRYTTFCGT